MLNQSVSIDKSVCGDPQDAALVPLPQPRLFGSADPILSARLSRAAAASGLPSPQTIPSAAVLLLSLHLPVKSENKRRAALPFVMEPFLAAPLDEQYFALGPKISEETYLCAAVRQSEVQCFGHDPGSVVPDLLAVPVPSNPAAWTLWCAEHRIFIRFSDGGGMSVLPETFTALWHAQKRPGIELAFGEPPPGVRVEHRLDALPDPDPSVFALNLNPSRPTSSAMWRNRVAFATCAATIVFSAHAMLAHLDARALSDVQAQRAQAIEAELAMRGLPADLARPVSELVDRLGQFGTDPSQDAFLALLTAVSATLTEQNVSLRDLRFDGASGTVTALVTGNTLSDLQQAERALKSDGLGVTSGSAIRTEAGAELQLTVSSAF